MEKPRPLQSPRDGKNLWEFPGEQEMELQRGKGLLMKGLALEGVQRLYRGAG